MMKSLTQKIITIITIQLIHLSASAPYKKQAYSQLLTKLKKIAEKHPDTAKYQNAKTTFKSLNKDLKCQSEEQCEFPIITLTNFKSSIPEIAQRPQILMIGSVNGDEPLGSASLLYFIESVVERRTSLFWELLQTRLIVVAPIPNPRGFYSAEKVSFFC